MILGMVALMLIQHWSRPQDRPVEKGRWICWEYSGKGNTALEIRESHPLSWFAEKLPEFDSEIQWRVEHVPGWKGIQARVAHIGKLAGRDVVDLFFTAPASRDPFGKMVLIGDHGRYRPVVWIVADSQVLFEPSRILDVSGRSVLENRDRNGGTGNSYYEDYFVFDEAAGVPINVAFDRLIASELSKMLPPGGEVRKGGGFDIAQLHYHQGVWKRSDPNCCPSDGTVDIQFELKGRNVTAVSAHYSSPR